MAQSFSPYKLTPLVIAPNGRKTYGLMEKYEFLNEDNLDEEDILRIIIKGDRAYRPDLLANDLYYTPIHYWILIMFNNVQNPFRWPKVNQVIKAPSARAVFRELT